MSVGSTGGRDYDQEDLFWGEEFDRVPTEGARLELLPRACRYISGLGIGGVGAPVGRVAPLEPPTGCPSSGLSPAWDGVVLATGHTTKGIHLGPVTGRVIADYVMGGCAKGPRRNRGIPSQPVCWLGHSGLPRQRPVGGRVAFTCKTPFVKTPFVKTPFVKTPFVKTPFVKTPFVRKATMTITAPAREIIRRCPASLPVRHRAAGSRRCSGCGGKGLVCYAEGHKRVDSYQDWGKSLGRTTGNQPVVRCHC